jgi:hypothetical protein
VSANIYSKHREQLRQQKFQRALEDTKIAKSKGLTLAQYRAEQRKAARQSSR